jgi:Rho-binding antiterminator
MSNVLVLTLPYQEAEGVPLGRDHGLTWRRDVLMTEYRPVTCGQHDVLQDVATRGVRSEIVYREENGSEHLVNDRVVDVFTRGDAEFTRLESGREVRLDHLVRVNETVFDEDARGLGRDPQAE